MTEPPADFQTQLQDLLAEIGEKSRHKIDIKVEPKPGRSGYTRVKFNGQETMNATQAATILVYLKGVLHGMQLND